MNSKYWRCNMEDIQPIHGDRKRTHTIAKPGNGLVRLNMFQAEVWGSIPNDLEEDLIPAITESIHHTRKSEPFRNLLARSEPFAEICA